MTMVDQSPKKVLTLLHPLPILNSMTTNHNHMPIDHDFPQPCVVCSVDYATIDCEHDGPVCRKCHEVRSAIRFIRNLNLTN